MFAKSVINDYICKANVFGEVRKSGVKSDLEKCIQQKQEMINSLFQKMGNINTEQAIRAHDVLLSIRKEISDLRKENKELNEELKELKESNLNIII